MYTLHPLILATARVHYILYGGWNNSIHVVSPHRSVAFQVGQTHMYYTASNTVQYLIDTPPPLTILLSNILSSIQVTCTSYVRVQREFSFS